MESSPCTINKDFEEELRATKGSETNVLKAFSVWVKKPHVANRRLCGAKISSVFRLNSKEEVDQTLERLQNEALTETQDFLLGQEEREKFVDFSEEKTNFTVLLQELIPKSEFFPNLLEAVVYDNTEKSLKFVPVKTKPQPDKLKTEELTYTLQFRKSDQQTLPEIVLTWPKEADIETGEVRQQVTSKWLRKNLLDKLVSWSEVDDISTAQTSLKLVSVDRYKETYVRLKNKYGRDLVKNWTERTDPKKFVYEDVAIAAYLLLIWEEDRKKKNLQHKQTFVDLGCGNGLLVYILTKEGHKGLGIDLRKRNIWDTFGADIKLKEEAVTPSGDHLFPEYDWIIGNHSDELTPWIPVIAARSSYKCNFFVLPCCHYDFVGKFNLHVKGKSQYTAYLDYVSDIVTHCGFNPETDTLRIPSTKRVCVIGRTRSYDEILEANVNADRQSYIEEHIASYLARQGVKKDAPPAVDVITMTEMEVSDEHKEERTTSDSQISSDTRLYSFDSGLGSLGSQDSDCSQAILQENPLLNVSSVRKEERNAVKEALFITYESQISSDSGLGSLGSLGSLDSSPAILQEKPSLSLELRDANVETVISHVGPDSPTAQANNNKKRNLSESENSNVGPSSAEGVQRCLKKKLKSDVPNVIVNSPMQDNWAQDFKPRVEAGVRNCQHVPDETKKAIVEQVFQKVLDSDLTTTIDVGDGRSWRKGGAVSLGDVVSSLDKLVLKELKAECGGLQTLLRNHSHVFMVTGGLVQLRDFTAADPWFGRKNKKARGDAGMHKTMQCWFYDHHPDGCPKPTDQCKFAHGATELKCRG